MPLAIPTEVSIDFEGCGYYSSRINQVSIEVKLDSSWLCCSVVQMLEEQRIVVDKVNFLGVYVAVSTSRSVVLFLLLFDC